MIPISLRFQGVYSYQSSAYIDFTKLSAAGIFGIFGAVGSGKSTILEAISFVLYGALNRLNNRDNIAYNLMNLQSNEMHICFEFQHESQEYKFEYFAKRSSKHLDKMSKAERKAYKKVAGNWEPISKDAAQILHLSYEEFKKIVIIPQGMFSEFIQLKPTERTNMLKTLFQLDQYDLYDKAKRLLNTVDTDLAILNSKLSELTSINQEIIESEEQIYNAALSQLDKGKIELEDLNIKVQYWKNLAQLHVQYIQLQTDQKKLLEQSPQIDSWKENLQQYKLTKQHFEALYHQRNECEVQLENLKYSQLQALSSHEQKTAELHNLQEQLAALEQEYTKPENMLSVIQGFEKQLSLRKLAQELLTLQKSVEHDKSQLEAYNKQAAMLQEAVDKIKSQLQNHTEEVASEPIWLQHQFTLSQIKQVEQAKQQLLNYISEQEKEIEQFTYQKQLLINELFKEDEREKWYAQPIQHLGNHIQLIKEENARELDALQHRMVEMQGWKKLQSFAAHLHEGQACPLCGALEHPHVYSSNVASQELESLKQTEQLLLDQQLKYTSGIMKIEHIIDNYRRYKSMLDQYQQEINKQEDSLQTLKASIPEDLDEVVVANKLATIQDSKKITASLNEQLEKNQNTIAQIPMNDIQQSIAQKDWKISQINTQIDIQKAEETQDLPLIEDIEALSTHIQKMKDDHHQWQSLLSPIQNLKNELWLLHEKNTQIQELIRQYEDKAEDLLQVWENRLKLYELENERVQQYIKSTENWADIEARILQHQQDLAIVSQQLTNVATQLNGQAYDAQAFNSLETEYKEMQARYAELLQSVGAIESKIKNLKSKYQQSLELQSQLEQKTAYRTQVDMLTKLFSGQGFVKYVSIKYLRNLVAMANTRFVKFTHHQLELDLDDDGNFVVIDYLNNGHKRLLKTLSGGQSFQAALSLALALSEQIQLVHKYGQQFFFLDEGFGSLDKQSLNVVIDTLKQVQQEGRVVGLISHVEELQSEIDYRLNVYNDPNTGSRIVASY